MGLIKAAVKAAQGVLLDQWEEYFFFVSSREERTGGEKG